MKFIKKENGVIVEAPSSKILENGTTIINYNSPSNKSNLLANGYLQYDGSNPLQYVDIVDGKIIELQYPPVSEIRNRLINELYELKSAVAYSGIVLRGNGHDYTFETNSTSITLINSTLVSASDDSTELNWKVYEGNEVAFLTLTVAELKQLFAFGMNMINTAFGVEGALLQQVRAMTDEQLSDNQYVSEFESQAREQFNGIDKIIEVNDL